MVTNPEVVLGMMEINHLDAEQFSTTRGIVWGWDQAVCVRLWKGSAKERNREESRDAANSHKMCVKTELSQHQITRVKVETSPRPAFHP